MDIFVLKALTGSSDEKFHQPRCIQCCGRLKNNSDLISFRIKGGHRIGVLFIFTTMPAVLGRKLHDNFVQVFYIVFGQFNFLIAVMNQSQGFGIPDPSIICPILTVLAEGRTIITKDLLDMKNKVHNFFVISEC